MLTRYTFERWRAEERWQARALEEAKRYAADKIGFQLLHIAVSQKNILILSIWPAAGSHSTQVVMTQVVIS